MRRIQESGFRIQPERQRAAICRQPDTVTRTGETPFSSHRSTLNTPLITALTILGLGCALFSAQAQEPPLQPKRLTDRIPYGQSPIDYFSQESDDPVAELKRRLDQQPDTLSFDDSTGYLGLVLKALQIPVESQLLVFSKTSVHQRLIGPQQPRAIYFNDDVTVGWVPKAPLLEIAALDPQKGAVFYTLTQSPDGVQLQRQDNCLTCHVGASTLNVPGFVARSYRTDSTGEPLSGLGSVTHATPLDRRWGGWYVTGDMGGQSHLGNRFGETDTERSAAEPSLPSDLPGYPARTSDVVAHLIFEHQMHFYNLVTRVHYEHRLGWRSDAEERLIGYVLFADEAPLGAAVAGDSGFAERYQQQGPFDAQGRSLRQLDLTTRLFKYRLSPLIYGRAWEGLPKEPKRRLQQRIGEILSGRDTSGRFDYLPEAERRAIREILQATKPDFLDPLSTR